MARALAHGHPGAVAQRHGPLADVGCADLRRGLSAAQNGEIAVVTQDGEPVFMTIPMGASLDGPGVRLELAVSLFDLEQLSIGVASRIAGLSISETIDELGRRRIPVARYSRDEFAEEMKYVRSLAGRR